MATKRTQKFGLAMQAEPKGLVGSAELIEACNAYLAKRKGKKISHMEMFLSGYFFGLNRSEAKNERR